MVIVTLLSSFIFAVMSGLGIGGGGLMVVYLAIFTSTDQLAAQGINLIFFLFSSGASILIHLKKRRILFSAVVLTAITGVIGAVAGAFFSGIIDSSLLRKAFGIMLMACGTLSLSNGRKSTLFRQNI